MRAPESRIYNYARPTGYGKITSAGNLLAAYIHDSQEFVIIPYRAIPLASDTCCPSGPFGGCRCVLLGQAVALIRETRARPLDDIGGGR
jgi:hypothetical protein